MVCTDYWGLTPPRCSGAGVRGGGVSAARLHTPGSRSHGRLTSAKHSSSAAVLQVEKPIFTSNPLKIRSSGKQGRKLQPV